MVTTISVTEDVKKELARLKAELGYPSMDFLIKNAIVELNNCRFDNASRLFRKNLREKGLTVSDVKKEGLRLRKEVFRERFQK